MVTPSLAKNLSFSGSSLTGTKLPTTCLRKLPTQRLSPFVVSPKAVSDSKNSQTCLDPDASRSVLGIILGGGAGTRLYPLTKKRAKPAVPLGANYRLKVDTTILGLDDERAKEMPYIASMGIYVVSKHVMLDLLKEKFPGANDFGSEAIPRATSIGLRGKLIQIHFSSPGKICGAEIQTCLGDTTIYRLEQRSSTGIFTRHSWLQQFGDVLPLYIWDDRTDEDALRVIQTRGQGFWNGQSF